MKKLIILIVIALAVPVEAKNLYVNGSTGNDSTTYTNNDSGNPWLTIGRAAWGSTSRGSQVTAEAAQAGDTVYIASGTYSAPGTGTRSEATYQTANEGTSSSNLITFEAVGTVILELSSGAGPVLGVNTRDYIKWDGFTVDESNAPGVSDTGPAILWDTTGSVIESCIIIGDTSSPLGNNHSGIYLADTNNCIVRNTKIYDILNYGVYGHNGAGILTYYTDGALFEHNEIYNCGSGIFIKGYDNQNNTARYNLIYRSTPGGTKGIMLGVATGSYTYIYQNIIYNYRWGIGLFAQLSTSFTGDIYIVNNTIVDTDSDLDSGGLMYNSGGTDTNDVYTQNNIVYYTSSSSDNFGANAYWWTETGDFFSDYNIYYQVSEYRMDGSAVGSFNSIASWRTELGGCPGTGNECGSITDDPLFVNAAGRNYKLQNGSPAEDAGVDILDLDGDSSTVDAITIGAYITGNEEIGIESEAATSVEGANKFYGLGGANFNIGN